MAIHHMGRVPLCRSSRVVSESVAVLVSLSCKLGSAIVSVSIPLISALTSAATRFVGYIRKRDRRPPPRDAIICRYTRIEHCKQLSQRSTTCPFVLFLTTFRHRRTIWQQNVSTAMPFSDCKSKVSELSSSSKSPKSVCAKP